MIKISDYVNFVSGSPQFRIEESNDNSAPEYCIYGQNDLKNDLFGIKSDELSGKSIRTWDKVNVLFEGDVVFSLISGTASIVSKDHEGYLYTQNYIKLFSSDRVDSKFLVYLFNEDTFVKKQFQMSLQGSMVMKYTLKQLKEIELPGLPSVADQRIMGEMYLKQLKVQGLKMRVAELETTALLHKMRGEIKYV